MEEVTARLRGVEERLAGQTSQFSGVRQNKRTGKYEAYIRVAGRHVHLGCHDSEPYAAQCYDRAVIAKWLTENEGEGDGIEGAGLKVRERGDHWGSGPCQDGRTTEWLE